MTGSWRAPDVVGRVLSLPTWAVVGLSGDPRRPAYGVAAFLQARGRRVVAVNPRGQEVLGEPGYRSLADIPFPVDVVDIFRRSDEAGQHVDEAVAHGARAVWLQVGVVDEEAARRAQAAGLHVVMDTCPRVQWPRFGLGAGS